jgi:pyrimidine-nucleoside phosphorylase
MKKSPAALIAEKRDGKEHSADDIHALIQGFLDGDIADYQMSAWLMASYLRGLSQGEMLALTEAMLDSGRRLERGRAETLRVDKHSTGGVGDKVSLPLAPLVAACGLQVPMISGRGLGHTGGTLDKLESIPGFSVNISQARSRRILDRVGFVMMGQTRDIAPADRRIYALRDVTATVACEPLIVASILSKKLAETLDGLVLDVKVGRGAFMKDEKAARSLARSLVDVSQTSGTPAVALLSNMDTPLGTSIGNTLEVKESIAILRGTGPADTTELTIELGAQMLLLGKVTTSLVNARRRLRQALTSGYALERFAQMVELQGGDARVVDDLSLLPQARHRLLVKSPKAGTVSDIDPLALAHLSLDLGSGRKRASDKIDPGVGIELKAQLGDRVAQGELLAVIWSQDRSALHVQRAQAAFRVGRARPENPRLILSHRIVGKSLSR